MINLSNYKWVINLSKYKLSNLQENLFAKGLNYSPSPTKISYEEYIVATEKACRKLSNNEATVLRSEMAGMLRNAKPPKTNFTKDERKAIQELKKEESVFILPGDKGKATVVIDVSEYEERSMRCCQMRGLMKNSLLIPLTLQERVSDHLIQTRKENKIDKAQYDLLYPTAENIPWIYCTPKVHKPGNKVRLIVDYTGTIDYQTSRALAYILSPLVGGIEHHVLNS